MKGIGTRLAKIEKVLTTQVVKSDRSHRFLMQLIAATRCHYEPGLDLVEGSDTDPATFAEIQVMLAEANWEHERAAAIEASNPRHGPVIPADLVAPGTSGMEAVAIEMRWKRQHVWPHWEALAKRRREAVDSARLRQVLHRAAETPKKTLCQRISI